MVETKTYARLAETGLCLAVGAGEIAVGRYDGVAQVLDAATGKVLHELVDDPFPRVIGQEGNDSPGTGQMLKLPASIIGKLGKPGDCAFTASRPSRVSNSAHAVTKEMAAAKFAPYLQLTDARGSILAEATDGALGYTFHEAGTYAVGIRDQDYRGGPDMNYRLHLGDIPVVTALFPLGLQRGAGADIHVQGVFLGARYDPPPGSHECGTWQQNSCAGYISLRKGAGKTGCGCRRVSGSHTGASWPIVSAWRGNHSPFLAPPTDAYCGPGSTTPGNSWQPRAGPPRSRNQCSPLGVSARFGP